MVEKKLISFSLKNRAVVLLVSLALWMGIYSVQQNPLMQSLI
jgi:Cu/Ag efflux pump CusA